VCQYKRWYSAGTLKGIKSTVFVRNGFRTTMIAVICVVKKTGYCGDLEKSLYKML
jgi:hypothetical protein